VAAVDNTASSPRSGTGTGGPSARLASNTAGTGLGPWYLARVKALSQGNSNTNFKSLGLPLLKNVDVTDSNRRVGSRGHGGVAGLAGDRRPYADQTASVHYFFHWWFGAVPRLRRKVVEGCPTISSALVIHFSGSAVFRQLTG